MQASVSVLLSAATPEVRLTHGQETLAFSISVFGRNNFQEIDVFEHINVFWSMLPEPQQTEIFEIYRNIHQGLENIWNKDELVIYLRTQIAALLEHHNLTLMQDWVAFRSNIQIPASFGELYEHSVDQNNSREKTYTRSDYIQLVSLVLCLRCMVPVWGEHISSIRRETGTLFKEFYSFQLLNQSSLLHSVPMEKLKVYIEHIIGPGKSDPNNTLKGISSEDFGYWLLALVCVRRLCIGDIRGTDPKANIITYIYKYIIQKVQNTDNNFENVVKEKKFDDGKSSDSENKISTLERYKIKTNISPGEIVELEFSIRDIAAIANKLTCKMSDELLTRSLETSSVLMHQKLLDPQMMLLRWVFKPVISPRGLMYLSKPMIVQALGALEAVLWARGYEYLALLATAHAITSDRDMVVSPVDSKMRVPKELSDELDLLYPYTKTIQSKKNGPKIINLAARSIDQLTDQLMMFSWRTTADEALVRKVLGSNSKRLPIKPDIKTDLTRLCIELGNRSWI